MENVPQDPRIDQLIDEVAELKAKLLEVSKLSEGYTFDTRNWNAVKQTMEKNEDRFDIFEKKIQSAMNLVSTLQSQFNAFQQQRAIELQKMVNYGPTSHENTDN